jgi:hypothetical protein
LRKETLFTPQKKIPRPDRSRQAPAQFSWLAQRLVRENFLRHGAPTAWALYLVLVIVADAQGLSYYSDATLSRLLKLAPLELARARQQLITAEVMGDNCKTAILAQPLGQPAVPHPRYLDFARHYGLAIKACGPRKPHEKGRAEKAAHYPRPQRLSRPAKLLPSGSTPRRTSAQLRPAPRL